MKKLIAILVLLLSSYSFGATAPESTIPDFDIKDVDFKNVTGSGQGTINALMFTGNGSNDNSGGSLNLDNANIAWPTGNGQQTGMAFDGSIWVTSFGELRQFYDENFVNVGVPRSDIRVTLFFDSNETGGDPGINMQEIDIFADVDFSAATSLADPRNDPLNNDITKDEQVINTPAGPGITTITRNYLINNNTYYLESLENEKLVGLNAQGGGIPDAVAFTGIDPYDPRFADSDNFVIWNKANQFSNGGDDMFLSGDFTNSDLRSGIPLPPAAYSVLVLLPLFFWRKVRSVIS